MGKKWEFFWGGRGGWVGEYRIRTRNIFKFSFAILDFVIADRKLKYVTWSDAVLTICILWEKV